MEQAKNRHPSSMSVAAAPDLRLSLIGLQANA